MMQLFASGTRKKPMDRGNLGKRASREILGERGTVGKLGKLGKLGK